MAAHGWPRSPLLLLASGAPAVLPWQRCSRSLLSEKSSVPTSQIDMIPRWLMCWSCGARGPLLFCRNVQQKMFRGQKETVRFSAQMPSCSLCKWSKCSCMNWICQCRSPHLCLQGMGSANRELCLPQSTWSILKCISQNTHSSNIWMGETFISQCVYILC